MNTIENQILNNSIKSWISCLVTNSKSEILMVFEKESNNRKLWWQLSIIFWNIEKWETPKAASIREIKEESWFDLRDVDFIWKKKIDFLSSIYSLYMFKSTITDFANSDFIELDTKGYQFLTKYDLVNLSPYDVRPWTLEVIACSLSNNLYSNINIQVEGNKYNELQFSSLQRLLKTII